MADKTVNTVEELVALATHPYSSNNRYQLHMSHTREYDDAAAGKTYEDEGEAIRDTWRATNESYWSQPDYVAWGTREPAKHAVVVSYSLYHRSSTWHWHTINLSVALGQQVDAVWTKKKPRYGNIPQPVGVLTLSGILKRLGRTDVGDKIKAAKDAEAAKYALNRRNNARRTVLAKVAELEKAMAEAEAAGVWSALFSSTASTFSALLTNAPELALENSNPSLTMAT